MNSFMLFAFPPIMMVFSAWCLTWVENPVGQFIHITCFVVQTLCWFFNIHNAE